MRTHESQVLDWLFPRGRKQMLTLLFAGAQQCWHLRELARKSGCAVGTVRREMKGLVRCGLILESRDGNRVCYQANRVSSVYPDLLALVRKTSGLVEALRAALTGLGDRIAVAFIYGSQARAEARPGSDVDLMVVGHVGFGEVVSALGDVQEEIAREINPTVYAPEELKQKALSGHHFVQSVLREPKVFLIGGDDELGELAGKRVAAGAPHEPSGDRGPSGVGGS